MGKKISEYYNEENIVYETENDRKHPKDRRELESESG